MQAHVVNILSPGQSFELLHLDDPFFPFVWHYHPEYELLMPLRGRGRIMVGDCLGTFAPGELFLLGPGLPHVFHTLPGEFRDGVEALVLRLAAKPLEQAAGLFPELSTVRKLLAESSGGLRFRGRWLVPVRERLRLLAKPHEEQGLVMAELLAVLAELAVHHRQRLCGPAWKSPSRGYDRERLERICEYLHRNFRHSIRLVNVARAGGVSPSRLCSFFRRATGHSVIEYANVLRVGQACRLLTTGDDPIIDIAQASGYRNLAHFNRQFRRAQGMTPRDYRRRTRGG
jgi:AraC-like DNA-binding protein